MRKRRIEPIYNTTYRQVRRRYVWTRTLLIIAVILVAIGAWMGWQRYKQAQLKRYPIQGVSLTQDNGFIDFQQLAKHGISFAYLRASSGATYMDDDFSSNYSRALGSDVKLGVYHVYSFSTSPKAQATNFEREVGSKTGTLPIAVQVAFYGEYNQRTLKQPSTANRLVDFIRILRKRYHQSVIIWCTPTVWRLLKDSDIGQTQRWVNSGSLTHAGTDISFIEYDDQGSVTMNGQTQTVPRSVFNGTKKQWADYLKVIAQ
ncbi:GH25 family lysozyme [Secundilactobacillus paracollinoides]|uniref:GH25 family lysozyme n=2 Tax=Secundilactobacillus paracollinoides TaxID=240427 RepID=UPI0006F1B480|nr:GH25 family lysozyme [Secundilactobacillus paracollinoides]KRL79002.1 Lyzozyme M1 (1,4-beta-N-acetylmuramidase) [Secundilactobacillus paracollinoides DSM 15502 = JCM 11969]